MSIVGRWNSRDAYTKEFLKQTRESVAAGSYDVTKMLIVLDALVAECSSIATGTATALDEAAR